MSNSNDSNITATERALNPTVIHIPWVVVMSYEYLDELISTFKKGILNLQGYNYDPGIIVYLSRTHIDEFSKNITILLTNPSINIYKKYELMDLQIDIDNAIKNYANSVWFKGVRIYYSTNVSFMYINEVDYLIRLKLAGTLISTEGTKLVNMNRRIELDL